MKAITLIILTIISIALASFKSNVITHTLYIQVTDSIPETNKKIIDFVTKNLNKKVLTGQCWDLASAALNAANANWDGKYNFGKIINYKTEALYSGDIIQFENVVLNYEKDGRKFTEKMMHHTAIIYTVIDKSNFTIAHQNNGYSGKKVGISPIDIITLTKGKLKIYRPQK